MGAFDDLFSGQMARSMRAGVERFYEGGGLAGLLGMPPWNEQEPMDIAMGFTGSSIGRVGPQLAAVINRNSARMAQAAKRKEVGPTIYHGSPHKFDWPEAGHELTGEGAAAYGRGIIYGAEAPSVGKSYVQNTLPAPPVSLQWPGGNISAQHVASEWAQMNEGRQAAINYLESLKSRGNSLDEADELALAYLKTDQPLIPESPGHLYEMKLSRQGEEFLDWDKPLSEQSEGVRKAIRGITHDTKNPDYIPMGIPDDTPGYNIYQAIIDSAGSDEAASAALAKAGIPGIRYFDQMSRVPRDNQFQVEGGKQPMAFKDRASAEAHVHKHGGILHDTGEGTRNYVLFDASSVRSVKRD